MNLTKADLEFMAELNGHNQPEYEKDLCPDCNSNRVVKISSHNADKVGIYQVTLECLDCGTTIIEN